MEDFFLQLQAKKAYLLYYENQLFTVEVRCFLYLNYAVPCVAENHVLTKTATVRAI
jgi:hypothetical protein